MEEKKINISTENKIENIKLKEEENKENMIQEEKFIKEKNEQLDNEILNVNEKESKKIIETPFEKINKETNKINVILPKFENVNNEKDHKENKNNELFSLNNTSIPNETNSNLERIKIEKNNKILERVKLFEKK